MILNYLAGAAVGALIIIIGYRVAPPKNVKLEREKNKQLKSQNRELEHENYELKAENARDRVAIHKNTERIEALENQMARCYEWFGSMIRHSAEEPFKKDAIEKFLEEHGLQDEE